jgi:serine/threonine protein kinase
MSTAFLERLEKVGLFGTAELEEIRQLASQVPEPKALAAELVRAGRLTRWQAGQLVLGRNIVLGKYVLIDVLSPDEINPLFLARHRAMERNLVLRVLAKQLSQLEEWRNRFLAEAQLWAALEHPRLVRAYNAEQDAGRYFLVLEFIDGDSLEQLVRDSGPLPPEAILQLAYEAAEGLQVLHAHGIAHGNLRPSKLMITQEGNVKLLDRGFSQWVRESSVETASPGTRELEGGWDWRAPEVQGGAKSSIQADLFSLGACLFYAATAQGLPSRSPEVGPTDWRGQCSEYLEDQPPEIRELLLELLAWDPAERPQIAEELLRRLEPVVGGTAASASSVGSSSEEIEVSSAVESRSQSPGTHEVMPEAAGMTLSAQSSGRDVEEPQEISEARGVPEGEADSGKEMPVATVGAEREVFPAVTSARPTPFPARGLKKASPFQEWKARWEALSKRQKIVLAGTALVGVTLFILGVWGLGSILGLSGERPLQKGAPRPEESTEADSLAGTGFPEIKADLTFDPTKFDVAPESSDSIAVKSRPTTSPTSPEESTSALRVSGGTSKQAGSASSEESGEAEAVGPVEGPATGSEMQPEGQAPERQSEVEFTPKQDAAELSPASETETKAEKPESTRAEGKQPAQALEKLFHAFPETVDLPDFVTPKEGEDMVPFEIGRVGGDPNTGWQLILLGGNQAFRKGLQFVLHEISVPGNPPQWIVQLESAGFGGRSQTVPVGKFFREGARLYFQWDPKAPDPTANYLRNCLLQVRVESESRYVRLRSPAAVEVPPIDLSRPVLNFNVNAKWLPAEDFISWEFVGMDGVKEAVEVEPKLPAPPRGVFMAYVLRKDRDGNTHRAVPIRMTFTGRSQGLAIRIQILAEKTPLRGIPGEPGNRNMFRSTFEQQRRELEKKLSPPDKKEPPKGAERSQILQQLRAVEEVLWYCQFMDDADKKARVRFRIFSEVAGQKLVFAEG